MARKAINIGQPQSRSVEDAGNGRPDMLLGKWRNGSIKDYA
jgi:hypothetical protein